MMTGRESAGAPFDEQAALEELERLQHAIEESRRQRGQTVEEFDAFVRSFKNPAPERDTQPRDRPSVRRSRPRRSCALAPPRRLMPRGSAAAAGYRRTRPTRCRRRPRRCRVVDVSEPVVRPRGNALASRTLIAGLAAIAVVVVAAVFLLNRRGASTRRGARLRSRSSRRRRATLDRTAKCTTRDPTGPAIQTES